MVKEKVYAFSMNEYDTVIHYSWEEAVKYYDNITGAFEENQDDETGDIKTIDDYKVFVDGDREKEPITVREALKIGEAEVPSLWTTEF